MLLAWDDAILVVGVSRHERIGLIQRIRQREPITLSSPEWLTQDQVDEAYSDLLPSKTSKIPFKEIAEVSAISGEGGELQAEQLS